MITIQKFSPAKNSNIDLHVLTQLRPHLTTPEKISSALQKLEKKGYVFFIAEQGEKILGFISLLSTYNLYLGDFVQVDDLIVDEAVRGQNIGSLLLEKGEAYAREKSISTIKLDSGLQRLQAHHFYEKNGYIKKCFTFEKTL